MKGLTYGPFAANAQGHDLPAAARWMRDLRHIAELGATSLRLYHPPPRRFLDNAADCGLRVLIDLPWDKHRCFLEDWSSQQDALTRARLTAAELGNHPAVLGISVANEIPKDIVRFYGARQIERFLGQLLDSVKQEAPECLTTYTNYPSTEFLSPGPLDFLSFNVYLEDPSAMGAYLDRLQHVAGPLPLVLGECGLDSFRHGEAAQARGVQAILEEVYCRGLAGAFLFSYTDDWFTGGLAVENWAFGITDRTRAEKPAARAVRDVWNRVPLVRSDPLPKVSVVVCAYNGGATLDECLESLLALNYPDYEVILVDDGSTDETPRIVAQYPSIRNIPQENRGLSAARNVGAQAAEGQIVAYTDADCAADPNWLLYLVTAMKDQQVEAIGGPNLPPPGDGWVSKCVAVSPGGPSHVMLDDRRAEHVPGCNMAFDRARLLQLGGFDPQFRVAGDDVDICWRFMEAGLRIGYAPSALVWHHRRATVKNYLRQQRGYGRAEAMLQFKHPHRFNRTGAARWNGIIYGEGAVGLPLRATPTYYGKFGTGLFQIVYRHNQYCPSAYFALLEWHVLATLLLVCSLAWHPLAIGAVAMWGLSLVSVGQLAARAPLPANAPWWSRPLVFALYLTQPIIRGGERYLYRLARKKPVAPPGTCPPLRPHVKRISLFRRDLYWTSDDGRGREQLLDSLVRLAQQRNWPGVFGPEWSDWDLVLFGGCWQGVRVHTVTEELGGAKRFTRARWVLRPTQFALAIAGMLLIWTIAASAGGRHWALWTAGGLWLGFVASLVSSGIRGLRSAARLLWQAGIAADLDPVALRPRGPASDETTAPLPTAEPDPAGLCTG